MNTKKETSVEQPSEQGQIPSVGSDGGFGSLAEAKRAGWLIRIRNIGPADWIHYGAYITHPTHGSDFLSDRNNNWMRADASRAALARINEMTPNSEHEQRGQKTGDSQHAK